MMKIDKIVLNDYLGPILVLTIETKCSRHQKYCGYLKILLSPTFSKKSGGTLFLVFRGRGAWRMVVGSKFLVGTLSP